MLQSRGENYVRRGKAGKKIMDANGKCALYTGCTIIISRLWAVSRVSSDWWFGAVLRLWLILTTLATFSSLSFSAIHCVASRCVALRCVAHPAERSWSIVSRAHNNRRRLIITRGARYRSSQFSALRLPNDCFFVYSANAIFSIWARSLRMLKLRAKRVYTYLSYSADTHSRLRKVDTFDPYAPFCLTCATRNSICVPNCTVSEICIFEKFYKYSIIFTNYNLFSSKSLSIHWQNIFNGKFLIIRDSIDRFRIIKYMVIVRFVSNVYIVYRSALFLRSRFVRLYSTCFSRETSKYTYTASRETFARYSA